MQSIASPFARLGLFRNPFGELTRVERAELAIVDVDEYLVWLESERAALQILGPCGHGKTTHLLAIESAWRHRGCDCHYVYFPEEGHQPQLPRHRPLLVDEAQRMGFWRRRELLRGSGPIVLGTHVDLTSSLVKSGFHVQSLNLSHATKPERLAEILRRRFEASRISNEPMSRSGGHPVIVADHPLCLTLDQVVELQRRFGSNIRFIEHILYEAFQRHAEKGEPWPPAK